MRSEPVRQVVREWDDLTAATRLGDRLSQKIAALIDSGEFGRDARLPPESELASRFGVSRPVIREALSHLRSLGVIVSRRGSGSYVQARPETTAAARTAVIFGPVNSLAQVRKCYEFRVSVEGDAAYYAAQNRTRATVATMRDALNRMQTAIDQGIVGTNADLEFHLAVAQGSGNEFFEAVLESMRTSLEFTINLARSLSLKHPIDRLLTVQAEHAAMFEAIEAGDKETARQAMRTHVGNACRRVFEGPSGDGEPLPKLD